MSPSAEAMGADRVADAARGSCSQAARERREETALRPVVENEIAARNDLGPERRQPAWLAGRHALPFHDLSDDEFEVFSYLLLLRECPGDRVVYYGKTGDAGRDVVRTLASGTVELVQCKRYSTNVGLAEVRAELAKLCTNVFRKLIPEPPDRVVFYAVPDLTAPAKDLLGDRDKWLAECEKALEEHLGEKPPADLVAFARTWAPEFGHEDEHKLTERARAHSKLIEEFFLLRHVVTGSLADLEPRLAGIERLAGSVETLLTRLDSGSAAAASPIGGGRAAESGPPLGKLLGVPPLPAHYVAREDRLEALRDVLRGSLSRSVVIGGIAPGEHGTARLGVHGMGGIGKSVLAAALASDPEVRRSFPDGVVWVRFGASPDITSLLRRAYQYLGGTGTIESDYLGKQRLKDLLTDQSVLLVLDDVRSRRDAEWFDVLGPRCAALLTTRDNGLLKSLGGAPYLVEALTKHEALDVLARSSGVPSEKLPPEAAGIVEECGGLPLAVALCGGMIRRELPWSGVLEQLRQARIDRIADRHAIEDHHRSVWHAIHVSVESLGPEERRRFLELAFLPVGETAPEATVAMLWAHTGRFDEWSTTELLTTLTERSLVQMTVGAPELSEKGHRFGLHDLIHDYVQQEAGDPTRRHVALVAAYREKCSNGWYTGPNDGYFFDHLGYHLKQAGLAEELSSLLGDARWLSSRLRVSQTGVVGLDSVLFGPDPATDGSLPTINSILIQGPPGTGKTQFALQLLVRMASFGSRCTLITTDNEEERARTLLQRVRLSGRVDRSEDAGLPAQRSAPGDPEVEVRFCDSTADRTQFFDSLMKSIPQDSAAVLIDDIPTAAHRQHVAALVRYLTENNILGLFVSETGMGRESGDDRPVLAYVADVVVALGVRETGGYRQGTIEVQKHRGQPHPRGIHMLRIQSASDGHDRGVEVVVFPSLHSYARRALDKAQVSHKLPGLRHTGFSCLDPCLAPRPGTMPHARDPLVLLSGTSSNARSLATNLLVSGLWQPDGGDRIVPAGNVAVVRCGADGVARPRPLDEVPLSRDAARPGRGNRRLVRWVGSERGDGRQFGRSAAYFRNVEVRNYYAQVGEDRSDQRVVVDVTCRSAPGGDAVWMAITNAVLDSDTTLSRFLLEIPRQLLGDPLALPTFVSLVASRGVLPLVWISNCTDVTADAFQDVALFGSKCVVIPFGDDENDRGLLTQLDGALQREQGSSSARPADFEKLLVAGHSTACFALTIAPEAEGNESSVAQMVLDVSGPIGAAGVGVGRLP
jgi:KaiC/GvpD/RAD55 family RecA-like ATPase